MILCLTCSDDDNEGWAQSPNHRRQRPTAKANFSFFLKKKKKKGKSAPLWHDACEMYCICPLSYGTNLSHLRK